MIETYETSFPNQFLKKLLYELYVLYLKYFQILISGIIWVKISFCLIDITDSDKFSLWQQEIKYTFGLAHFHWRSLKQSVYYPFFQKHWNEKHPRGKKRDFRTPEVRRKYEGSTREYEGVRREYEGIRREYKGLQGSTREYEGSTSEYEGSTREYEGSTKGVQRSTRKYGKYGSLAFSPLLGDDSVRFC